MYQEQIKNLQNVIKEQNNQLNLMVNDPNKNEEQFILLDQQRLSTIKELQRLIILESTSNNNPDVKE